MSAALALDIDGTIDTADPDELQRLSNYTDRHDIKRYINTARSQAYCDDPDPLSTDLVNKKKHHCLIHRDPPTSKVLNMQKIQKSENIDDARCVVLIDDRPENIDAVRDAGFSAVQVDARHGIQKNTVNRAQRLLYDCVNNKRSRGVDANDEDSTYIERLVTRIIILVAIFFLLFLLCRI
jgi:hypothetical protein